MEPAKFKCDQNVFDYLEVVEAYQVDGAVVLTTKEGPVYAGVRLTRENVQRLIATLQALTKG